MKVAELDTTKTYVLGVNPPPNVAVQTREYQKCAIHMNERWTQVGILVYIGMWSVMHVDIDDCGVSIGYLSQALREAQETQSQLFVFQHDFDVDKAFSLIGTP